MRRTDRYLSDNQDNITLRQGSLPRPQGTSSIYMLHHTERAPLTELGGDTSLTESGNQEAGLARSFTGQGSVGSDANQSLRNSLLTAAGYSADLDLQRDNNPLRHYLDFITDDTAVNRSEQLVTTYQPGASTEAVKELLVSERNPELESSLSRYLPVFDEILGSSSATNDEDDEFDDEDKDANMFVNFDLNEAIKELKEKEYLTPSVDDDTVPVFPGIPKTVDTAVSLASETRSSSSVSDAVPVANTDVTGVATGVTGVDTDVTGGISRVSTQQVDRQGEAQGIKGGSNALTEEIKGVSNALTEEIKGGSNALTEEMKGGSNALTDLLEEENISGDELFKSGSEMTQAMESLTLAVDKPSTLVGEEKAGTSDSHIVNVNFPIPPMCAPSRGDETILRAQTADLRIAYPKNSNEPTAMIHRPLASTLDIRLSRWNTNTNAGFPADQSTFIAGLSPVSRTLPSSTARQLPPTAEDISRNILKQESDLTKVRPKYPSFYAKPSAMDTLTGNLRQANPPNQSQQQNYPYSFQTERTSQGIIQNLSPYSVSSSSSGQGSSTPTMRSRADSTRLVNPSPDPSHSEHASLYRDNSVSEPHSTATAFRLGSESTSSSSGHEESYKLQGHGKHLTNQNSASSDASVRQFEVSDDDTRSFQTSTPIRKPVKAKQQKDAMNEMLKSYKAQQGITLGRGSAVLNPISDSPDPSAHLSPQEQRRPLHLDVSGNVAPTQRGSQVHHVQSAPVIGQPPLYGDHHRVSKVPKSATPPKEIKRWPSKSPSSASASASPSTRSQFDQQDLAFGE